MRPSPTYLVVDYPEPHVQRAKRILAAHPEVKELFGYERATAWITLLIVGLQISVAVAVAQQPGWVVFLAAYTIGALANHALFVVIHECAHNLVFRRGWGNLALGIFANLPIVFPSSVSFKKYHLLHHRHQGKMEWDADLAGPREARVFGRSVAGKALWLLGFFAIEGFVRPSRVRKVKLIDRWTVANIAVEVAFLAGMTYFLGWNALAYLALASVFSIGLHPVGARWIQEHYVFRAPQETYSYYGPLNRLCLNVGYHNEHHDLVRVPWTRLPRLKAMAPEFYDSLHSHRSWTMLLLRFLFDREVTLESRVIRGEEPASHETASIRAPSVEEASLTATT